MQILRRYLDRCKNRYATLMFVELPTGASLITDEDILVINVVTPGEQDLGDEPVVAEATDEAPAVDDAE